MTEHQYDYRPPMTWQDYALLPIALPIWLLMKYYSGTRYITGGYLPPLMFLWLIPPAGALWAVDAIFNLGLTAN